MEFSFPFSSATISTFVHATEDEAKLKSLLDSLLPGDVKIRGTKASGHYGNLILILAAEIRKRADLREFWDKIVSGLGPEGKRKLLREASRRVSEDCFLYLRFDKQRACEGEFVLTDSGDAIHVQLKIAAYPARREVALRLVEDFIKSGLNPEASNEPAEKIQT